MKRMLSGAIFLVLVMAWSIPAPAQVSISVGIALPPPIVFSAPPVVVVLPDTYDVYVVPDIDIEIFFWNGLWWRLWEGRWYRSRYYDRGWVYYQSVPSFYFEVDPGWRVFYRERMWHGHRWNYVRIPDRQLKKNWRSWHNNRYWERPGRAWGVQNYRSRPPEYRQQMRQHREMEYRQRPEVQRHEQERRERQMQPQVREPRRPPQPRQMQPGVREPERQPQPRQMQPQVREPQRPPQPMGEPRQQMGPPAREPQRPPDPRQMEPGAREPRGGAPHPEPQGRPPEGGDGDHRK